MRRFFSGVSIPTLIAFSVFMIADRRFDFTGRIGRMVGVL